MKRARDITAADLLDLGFKEDAIRPLYYTKGATAVRLLKNEWRPRLYVCWEGPDSWSIEFEASAPASIVLEAIRVGDVASLALAVDLLGENA